MLAAILLATLLSLLPAISAQRCNTNSVNVSFTSSPVSPPIPADYISFSIEVDVILEWTGHSPTTTRPQFTSLMSQLGRPTIRVGGDSSDYSWYNPSGQPYPPYRTRQFRYNITELDIHSIRNGVASYGGQAVIGVNFRDQGNAEWAIEHVRAMERVVGLNDSWLLAIEIGNEVDLSQNHVTHNRAHALPLSTNAVSRLCIRVCMNVSGTRAMAIEYPRGRPPITTPSGCTTRND